jgi:hypothetical protein
LERVYLTKSKLVKILIDKQYLCTRQFGMILL